MCSLLLEVHLKRVLRAQHGDYFQDKGSKSTLCRGDGRDAPAEHKWSRDKFLCPGREFFASKFEDWWLFSFQAECDLA